MKCVAIFVLLLVAKVSPSEKGFCSPGWLRFGNSCYLFSSDLKRWKEAQTECSKYGNHLVRINNNAENEYLKSVARSLNAGDFWFDLTDEDKEGHWRFSSFKANKINFTDWGKGEPNGKTSENCGSLSKVLNYQWNDSLCTQKTRYICEAKIKNDEAKTECSRTKVILDELVECKRTLASKKC